MTDCTLSLLYQNITLRIGITLAQYNATHITIGNSSECPLYGWMSFFWYSALNPWMFNRRVIRDIVIVIYPNLFDCNFLIIQILRRTSNVTVMLFNFRSVCGDWPRNFIIMCYVNICFYHGSR